MGTEVITPAEDTTTTITVTELEKKIIRQIEYYFGDCNLSRDKFLREQMKQDDGWIPLETMVKFNRLKTLSEDFSTICTAIGKSTNELIEVNEDSTKIRRRSGKPIPDESYFKNDAVEVRSLYVKGFRKNITLDELLEFFKGHKVENIFMRRYPKNRNFKGSCFVMFDTVEDAEKFLENKSIKFEGTELLKEKKRDYIKRKDVIYANLRAEKAAKAAGGGKKEEGDKDDKEVPEIDFTLGCLLKVVGLGSSCSREDLKKDLEEFGTICYVDYIRGNPEAVVRFETGVAANVLEKAEEVDGEKKFTIGGSKATVSVVEGDSEKEYWKNISKFRANTRRPKFQQNQHRQGKGRFKKQWNKRPKGNRRDDDDSEQPASKRFKGNAKEESESQPSNGKAEGKMDQSQAEPASAAVES